MKFTLVYDSDCGPCTRFSRAVLLLDGGRRVSRMGLAEADESGILASVPPPRRHRSFHLAAPDGEVWSGPAALPTLVGLLPGGWLPSEIMARNGLAYKLGSFVYSVFSRLHDAGSCSYPTSSAGARKGVPGPRSPGEMPRENRFARVGL